MISCVSLFNSTNNAVHHRYALKYIPLYFFELSGHLMSSALGQKLGFGSEIMQLKYEKIVGTTETYNKTNNSSIICCLHILLINVNSTKSNMNNIKLYKQ